MDITFPDAWPGNGETAFVTHTSDIQVFLRESKASNNLAMDYYYAGSYRIPQGRWQQARVYGSNAELFDLLLAAPTFESLLGHGNIYGSARQFFGEISGNVLPGIAVLENDSLRCPNTRVELRLSEARFSLSSFQLAPSPQLQALYLNGLQISSEYASDPLTIEVNRNYKYYILQIPGVTPSQHQFAENGLPTEYLPLLIVTNPFFPPDHRPVSELQAGEAES